MSQSTDSTLVEIVVQAAPGANPEQVAHEWARRLGLRDGARVTVESGAARPRRYIAHGGMILSPQRHAALMIGDALEQLMRAEGRPMDAWEILQAARRHNSPVANVPTATIRSAARLLARERRLRPGPTPGAWVAPRRGEAAA